MPSTQTQTLLSKIARISARNAGQTCGELLSPVFLLALILPAFPQNFLQKANELDMSALQPHGVGVAMAGNVTNENRTKILPSVNDFGVCNAEPTPKELQAIGSHNPPNSCFRYLDGRSIASQCRCSTLGIVGPANMTQGFVSYLTNASVISLMREFTEKWRQQKPQVCPRTQEIETAVSESMLKSIAICGIVHFSEDKNRVEVKVNTTEDGSIYRSFQPLSKMDNAPALGDMMFFQECEALKGFASACQDMFTLYQVYAFTNLQHLAMMYLHQDEVSRVATSSPAFKSLLKPGATLTIYNLPAAPAVNQLPTSDMVQILLMIAAMLLPIVIAPTVFATMGKLINEKHQKQKEGMRIMGMADSAYYASWLLWFLLHSFILAVLVVMLFAAKNTFSLFSSFIFAWTIFIGVLHTNTFAAALSTFFSGAHSGGMIGALIYILTSLFAVYMPRWGQILLLLPGVHIGEGLKACIVIEIGGRTDLEVDHMSPLAIFVTGFFGCIFWQLLYTYLDQVISLGVGQSRHPCFCCSRSFWHEVFQPSSLVGAPVSTDDLELASCSATGKSEALLAADTSAQRLPAARSSRIQAIEDRALLELQRKGQCVELNDVEVVFTGVNGESIRAVDGLSFTMYPGEIFVLLGHNGAGKSTTIGVLSGLVQATGGMVHVFGKKVPQELDEVRQRLGICPQHDVLWDDLTCIEHLEFYARLKGTDIPALRHDSGNDVLHEIGLGPRRNFRSSALSGGMKRKLSVSIAFGCSPSFVILDEPTSGMDPFSRRVVWDFLRRRREGCAVLLTTHFMDEADVLADRVAVMAHGRCEAYGDTQFLKRRFGCGYVVTIVQVEPNLSEGQTSERLTADLHALVEKEFSNIQGLNTSTIGKETLVHVPFVAASSIPQLLRALENARSSGDNRLVANYGVSVSSLEEVFLRIASGNHATKEEHLEAVEQQKSLASDAAVHDNHVDDETLALGEMISCQGSQADFTNQSLALLKRRARAAQRDMRNFLITGLSPVAMLLLGCLIVRFYMNMIEKGIASREILPVNPRQVLWASLNTSQFNVPDGALTTVFTEDDLRNVAIEEYSPTEVGAPCYLERGKINLFRRALSLSCIAPPSDYCNDTAVSYHDCVERWQRHVVLFAQTASTYKANRLDAGVLSIDGYLVVWANDMKRIHSAPIAVSAPFDVLEGPRTQIKATFMMSNMDQQMLDLAEDVIRYFVLVFVVNSAFGFIPTGVVRFAMMEKVKEVKAQLFISGCTYKAYWLCNLLFDCIFGLIPVAVSILLFILFQIEQFQENLHLILTMMLLFLPAACGMAYCLSLCFKSDALATMVVLALSVIVGSVALGMVIATSTVRLVLTVKHILSMASPSGEARDFFNSTAILNATNSSDMGPIDPAMFLEALNNDYVLGKVDLIHKISMGIGIFIPGFSLAEGLNRLNMRHMLIKELAPSMVTGMALENFKDWLDIVLQSAVTRSLDQGVPDSIVLSIAREVRRTMTSILGRFEGVETEQAIANFTEKIMPHVWTSSFTGCYIRVAFGPFNISQVVKGEEMKPIQVEIPCDGFPVFGPAMEEVFMQGAAGDAVFRLLFLAIFWPSLAIIAEALLQSPRASRVFVPKEAVPPGLLLAQENVDEDVAAESTRVEELNPKSQIILVRNLRRAFKEMSTFRLAACTLIFSGVGIALYLIHVGIALAYLVLIFILLRVFASKWAQHLFGRGFATHAVRGVSWAADGGMVFGLLGINGAGKTTTFKMMSGLLTPSCGEVKILGLDVTDDIEACRRLLGYCPQFDCLIDFMTTFEHIELFGRVKGLSGQDLVQAVQHQLDEMQLLKYRDRRAGTLSGGNKRKLSVSIALIGEPPIIFLDEPSTGMDPFARRFMWQVINSVALKRKKSVVVLTTHSMEEGEALCSKITIQVDGQLRCFGSIQQVKSRYGTGYEIPVKFKPLSDQQRHEQISALERLGIKTGRESESLLTKTEVSSILGSTASMKNKLERVSGHGAPFSQDVHEVSLDMFVEWWILDDLVNNLCTFLEEAVAEKCVLLEHHGLAARLLLPDLNSPSKLSQLFDTLAAENGRAIDDFAVCQNSLEQVFNNFARQSGQTAST